MRPCRPFVLLHLPPLAVGLARGATVEDCESLAGRLSLPDTAVLGTAFVAAGTRVALPGNHPTCAQPSQVADVDLCRVALLATTGPTSNVSLEAWLPLDWSGRFLGVGNGGMNGCIKYADLNYGASHRFATVGTNNGHDGTSGAPFYNNPGVLEDYVYRAVHLEAALGKAVAAEFYGEPHTRAYYLGCSTGGRQGFKEAQSFPDDFDGIVAGAPAFNLNALQYWTGRLFLKTGASGDARFLTPAQWALVNDDIMAQCDGLDGLEDGILEASDLCRYRPAERLVCRPADPSESCLTREQAATVRAVFSPEYGSDGRLIYPRLQPGTALPGLLLGGRPNQYPLDWFRYALFGDPAWDISTLGPRDYDAAARLDPFNASTWQGDLSRARDRGVKILHYHGMQDPAISAEISQAYYDRVSRTMGLPPAELDAFYRYFRISGMGHCSGGTGAALIGGSTNGFASFDPDANVLAAVVRWVEEGVAPDYILGSRRSPAGDVDLQRRHCKYPARNVFKGEGDPSKPDGWECV